MGNMLRRMPLDQYQWTLWVSESEETAFISVNSSGSGGALHPIPFEMGKDLRETLDEIVEETYDPTPRISIDKST